MLPLGSFGGSQTQYLQKVAMVQKKRSERASLSGSYNFTDLAQMVCKVKSSYGVTTDDGMLGIKLLMITSYVCRQVGWQWFKFL